MEDLPLPPLPSAQYLGDVFGYTAEQMDERCREYGRMVQERCAVIAEDEEHRVEGSGYYDQLGDASATQRNIAAAIRASKETP